MPAAWANLRDPPSSAELDALAEAWAAECRRLVVMADDARLY